MIAVNKPTTVREICEDYAHLFKGTKLSFGPFSSLVAISFFGISSLSEGARSFPLSQSVSTLSESIKDFDAEKFMKRARKILMNSYNTPEKRARLIFAVDDTPILKSGDHIFGVGLWTTSNRSTYLGQKLLVLVAIDSELGTAFPISFRICLKAGAPGYKTGHDLVLDLLDEALASGFPSCPLVADCWFDSVNLIQGCRARNIHVYLQVKPNRKVRHATSRKIPKKWSGTS